MVLMSCDVVTWVGMGSYVVTMWLLCGFDGLRCCCDVVVMVVMKF